MILLKERFWIRTHRRTEKREA